MNKRKPRDLKRQIKFECSEEFYRRLVDEKLQRNLTLQQLAIRALEQYFGVPEYLHRGIEEVAKYQGCNVREVVRESLQSRVRASLEPMPLHLGEHVKNWAIVYPTSVAKGTEDIEFITMIQAIVDYLLQLPTEKVCLLRKSLALDVKYYRSARIKPLGRDNSVRAADTRDTEGDSHGKKAAQEESER